MNAGERAAVARVVQVCDRFAWDRCHLAAGNDAAAADTCLEQMRVCHLLVRAALMQKKLDASPPHPTAGAAPPRP